MKIASVKTPGLGALKLMLHYFLVDPPLVLADRGWNNSPRVDISPHSDTLFFLLHAACFAEKQKIPIV
jgi:hypothetical protein